MGKFSFRFCEVYFNIFLTFAAVLFSCRPTRLHVAVKIEVETNLNRFRLNHNINRSQTFLKSGLEWLGCFSYSIKCKCL